MVTSNHSGGCGGPFRRPPVSLAVFLAFAALVPGAVSLQQKGAGFGIKAPALFNLKGTIYFPPGHNREDARPVRRADAAHVIYTDRLDIPIRDCSEGLPGVTDRFDKIIRSYPNAVVRVLGFTDAAPEP